MGRKGIGKLAALYLSNRFYLVSKTKDDKSAWCFDMTAGEDSEIPSLERINIKELSITAGSEWDKCITGTMIKLEHVDLTNIGIQTIEGLKARLSDYYLVDSIEGKIELAVLYHKRAPIQFMPIKKSIAYKNFYAVYDNSGYEINKKIRSSVTFPSNYEEIRNKPRETVILDSTSFKTNGSKMFEKEDEHRTKIEIPYQMTGWIGIHASIKKDEAQKNDPLFLKNKAYKSTQLRLYVRNKLAVEDFLPYIKNTQAFVNYIEGEISFDILDDNALGDIATSNRQGFAEDDNRITLLIDILKPIINSLINQRIKIGQTINQEETDIQKRLEEEKQAAEISKEKAENEKIIAQEKQREAEKQCEEAKNEAQKYHMQNNVIFDTVSEDQKKFSAKTHLIKTDALTIRNSVTTLAKKLGIDRYKELSAISISTDKILSALKYSALAKFNIEDEFITNDLFVFCSEYIQNVLGRQYYNIEIQTSVSGEYIKRFKPQFISLIFDNLFSNAEKSNSTIITISMQKDENGAVIEITDDGNGFAKSDTERAFEFGFSNTGGTGIGLYNVQTVIRKMGGDIVVRNNSPKGAVFTITL